jgi:hypothetical protein
VSVHIEELHTEVTPGGGQGGTTAGGEAGGDAVEERVARAHQRAECLNRRVAAEAFDD